MEMDAIKGSRKKKKSINRKHLYVQTFNKKFTPLLFRLHKIIQAKEINNSALLFSYNIDVTKVSGEKAPRNVRRMGESNSKKLLRSNSKGSNKNGFREST